MCYFNTHWLCIISHLPTAFPDHLWIMKQQETHHRPYSESVGSSNIPDVKHFFLLVMITSYVTYSLILAVRLVCDLDFIPKLMVWQFPMWYLWGSSVSPHIIVLFSSVLLPQIHSPCKIAVGVCIEHQYKDSLSFPAITFSPGTVFSVPWATLGAVTVQTEAQIYTVEQSL